MRKSVMERKFWSVYADTGIKLPDMDSKDFLNSSGVKVRTKYGGCSRCLDLEDEIKKANENCKLLELDIAKQKNVVERLEVELGFMELQKLKFEDRFKVLEQRNEVLETSIRDGLRIFSTEEKGFKEVVDLTGTDGEEDKFTQFITEHNMLACEKEAAEHETEVWKVKFKELEMQVLKLQGKLLGEMTKKDLILPELDSTNMKLEAGPIHAGTSSGQIKNQNNATEEMDGTGTPPANVISKMYSSAEDAKGSQCELNMTYGRQVRKCLSFDEGIPSKNFPPPTSGDRPPFNAIDISDSDENLNTPNLEVFDHDEDEVTCYRSVTYLPTPKRKRVKDC